MKRIKKLFVFLFFILIIVILLFILIHKKTNTSTIIHISFDDTINIFKDLSYNEESYDSIFDNELLGHLKFLHEQFGSVFSFYCYYEDGDFDLSQFTDKYQKDFISNSNWLKFGYHATNSDEKNENLSVEETVSRYNNFTSEILRITGGTDSLDLMPRIHYYSGTKDNLIAINQTSNGTIGYLSADDDRISYYLPDSLSDYVDKNDYLIDNNLIFVSTDLRLENTSYPYHHLSKIKNDDKQNKIIEVFTHEWKIGDKMKIKLWLTCFWAYKNGYYWDYPMNYFDYNL